MRRSAFLLAAVLVAGCGGGGSKISVDRLSELVLHDRDLPKAFSSFYVGAQTRLDATSSARANPTRFGRKSGWIARFTRPGTKRTQGPLVVVSRADIFGDSGGAKDDLGSYSFEFASQPGVARHAFKPPQIGDETVGTTFLQPGTTPVRFFVIAWRYRNATASVTVEGFADRVSRADAIRLARRQQQLLEAH